MWLNNICILFSIFLLSCYGIPTRRYDKELAVNQISSPSCGGSMPEIQRFIIHNENFYVGATNLVLRLNPTLTVLQQFVSGPGNDSQSCSAPFFCATTISDVCPNNVTCHDNRNTLLLTYRNRLLACGTLYQTCDILNLDDISTRFGNLTDLKCLGSYLSDNEKLVLVSSRDPSSMLVGAIYENNTSPDSDIFYLGKNHENTNVVLLPSREFSYFTVIDKTSDYLFTNISPEYYYAWANSNYGFMLWTPESSSQIKLSRYCNRIVSELSRSDIGTDTQRNHGLRSYTEITLQCHLSGTLLSKVIDAKVELDKLYLLFQSNQNQIVLCSANLTSINQEINFVRQQCWTNKNQTSARSILKDPSTSQRCSPFSDYKKDWGSCGIPNAFAPYVSPIEALEPLNFSNDLTVFLPQTQLATGFTIVQVDGLSSAFIGTSDGKVLKIRFGDNKPVSETISTGQSTSVLKSMLTYASKERLYFATKNSMFEVAVANCSNYETCDQCIMAEDIYCGWCVLQSRCTRRNACASSDQLDRWIKPTSNSNLCPKIESLEPSIVSYDSEETTLNLTFSGTKLQTSLNYTCQFGVDGSLTTFRSSPLKWINKNIIDGRCQFDVSTADVIPTTSDHRNVSVNVVYNGRAVVSKTFQVYSCSRVKDLNSNTVCTSCVTSRWGCSWCSSTATCSRTSTCTQSIASQSDCPRVLRLTNTMLSIPVGISYKFTLSTQHIFEPYSGYRCRYEFCGKSASSAAVILNSTMAECTVPADELTCQFRNVSIHVFLERSEQYTIDVTSFSSNQRTLFNCSVAASSCGTCIVVHNIFNQCGWCPTTRSCQVTTGCPNRSTHISSCSGSTIISVTPVTGPLQGGTVITITGTNLGSVASDISHVMVGTINCTVIKDQYIPSKRVVCQTKAASSERASGIVEVHTTYGNPIQSSFQFESKNVVATSYSPLAVLNQSLVTVNGSNLDVSSTATLSYGSGVSSDSVECTNRSTSFFTCRVGFHHIGRTSLILSIDKFRHNFSTLITFVSIPKIVNFPQGPIQVFSGAGKNLKIPLSSVDGIQKVELEVQGTKTECIIEDSSSSVTCKVPVQKVTSSSRRKRRQAASSTPAYLVLNDVHEVSLGDIQYQPNPVLSDEVVLPCASNGSSGVNSSATVQIPGKNFDETAASKSDIIVTLIPEESLIQLPCITNIIDTSVIFCRVQLSEWNKYREQEIRVNVTIGELALQSRGKCDNQINIIIIAVVTAAAVIFVLIILIIILIWLQRKKRLQQEEERMLILSKLDDLENKTRETARNAYYELQLGYMDNLAGNLTQRIIYLSPELYFTQTLFNMSQGHPILDKSALKNEPAVRIEAIQEWSELLKNREFLMVFIRTLEEQKRFTVQEKGHVASLLTVSLFSNMPYLTSIMFDLLTELIQKHVQKNPKLLLRRSESVVEKMVSHWLSITLYDECIMEKTGEPIFLLTKAVHFLVNSGPSDVVEHKSLNSLNESTLLSSEISFVTRVLLASIQDEETEKMSDPVEVSVVNVDTITQVKAKVLEAVYKDKPYSEYPNPDDLDLMLLSGENSKEGISLSDIDSTSVAEGSYKKINTLKHYNIPEKARLLLRPKGMSNPASPTINTPLINSRKTHIYHLIHPHDEEALRYNNVENGGGKKTKAVLQDRINKPLQEIYLTRMVRSKTTIQDYVDKVFNSVLSPDPIPYAIRYFFQFLDREAARHRINDSEVIHIWKTNSLLLRYWVNILKNPEFIFDINKTVIVDSCLNVITQAFMDACAVTNRKLGQDSPSNKLLYAKESQQYKKMVKEFFVKVGNTAWMDEKEMNEILIKTSQQHSEKFNQDVANQQLFQYLFKYKDQILEAVRDVDREDLANQVESVMSKMEDKNATQTTVM